MISRRAKRAAIGFVFVGVIALILFFSVDRYLANQAEIQRLNQEKADIKPRPQNVYTIRRESRDQQRTYSAQIQPWIEAEVPAEVAGRVTAVYVEPGSTVKAGDVLVELDPKTSQINLRASEARLREAKRLQDEASRLLKEEVISRTEFESRRSSFEIAQAEHDAAQRTYDLHFIRAPFDGVINERYVDVGDPVDLNSPVAKLVELNQLRVIFYVNDRDILSLQPGQRLDLSAAGLDDRGLHPQIQHIGRMADSSTRLFRVEAVLDNATIGLPGGISGTVAANIASYRDLPFVPASAVRLIGDKATVLRLEPQEKVTEAVVVEIGPEVDGFYPVQAGLSEGDKVLIR